MSSPRSTDLLAQNDQEKGAEVSQQRLTCRRCGSDRLVLVEITQEFHHWTDGLMLVDGEIQPVGEAYHETGEILSAKSWIRCEGCKYQWHPRRRIGLPYEGETT